MKKKNTKRSQRYKNSRKNVQIHECKDLMSELRIKKAEIDAYINAEAKKLVEQQEAALLSQYADKKKHLENQYTKREPFQK